MKRVGLADIGEEPNRVSKNPPSGDLGAQLAMALSGLDDIAKVLREHKTLTSELATMHVRVQTLEKLCGQMVQYQKDHNELHRNMAAEHGKKTVELEKAVAQAITASQQDLRAGITMQSGQLQEAIESQRQHMMANLTVIQRAMETFSGKEIKVDVNVPEQSVQQDQTPLPLLDYVIVRKGNLLERVREEHQK